MIRLVIWVAEKWDKKTANLVAKAVATSLVHSLCVGTKRRPKVPAFSANIFCRQQTPAFSASVFCQVWTDHNCASLYKLHYSAQKPVTSCRLLSSTVPHWLALKRRSQNMLQISIHRNFGYRNRYMYTFVTCRVFPCGVLFLLCILYGILSPCCGLCFVGYLQCVNVW